MTTAIPAADQPDLSSTQISIWKWAKPLLWFATLLLLALILALPPLYVALALFGAGVALLTLRHPFVGLCLLPSAVSWTTGFTLSSSLPLSPTDVLIAFIGIAWIASSVAERSNPITTRIWTPYIFVFIAVIALSVSQAGDRQASLRELLKWIELLVVFLAAVKYMRSRSQVRLIVVAIVAAGVSQALLGYIQSVYGLGPAAFTHGQFLRAYGTFDQPNPYAGFLNLTLPFAVAMLLFVPSRRERFWYGTAAVIIFGALLASESRGALLASLLALAVILSCASRSIFRVTWIGVLAAVLGGWLATLGLVPLSPFSRLLNAVGLGDVSFGNVNDANFSAVERAAHWLAGVRMFAAHPLLGVGIGNYAFAYPAYHPRSWYAPLAHAHNYYINIAAEAGVLGLIAYLLLAVSALWYSYAVFKGTTDKLYKVAVLGVLGALTATAFHNFFDVLYVHGIVALLGLLMALTAVSVGKTADEKPSSHSKAA